MSNINKIKSLFSKEIEENIILATIAVMMYSFIFRDLTSLEIWQRLEEHYIFLLNIRIVTYIILIIFIIINITRKSFSKRSLFIAMALLIYSFFVSLPYEYIESTKNGKFYFELPTWIILNMATKDINYNKIIKMVFITFCSLYSVLLLQVIYGYLLNDSQIRNGVFRYFLGKGAAVFIPYAFMYILFYYSYLRNRSIKLTEISFFFILNLVLYYLTSTRSVFIIVNLFLILLFVLGKYYNNIIQYKKFMVIMCLAPVLFSLLIIILALVYDANNPILLKLNVMLNGRLHLSSNAISDFGIKLFGNGIEYSVANGSYNNVDSSYLRFLLNYGIVSFALFIIMLVYFLYLAYAKNDFYLFVILLFSFAHMTFNLDLFRMCFNYLLFIWSYYNSQMTDTYHMSIKKHTEHIVFS